jgi:hypothetical protein
MDLRLLYKERLNVGIECKNKKLNTLEDYNKFFRDKAKCKYDIGIFVSCCPINITNKDIKIT